MAWGNQRGHPKLSPPLSLALFFGMIKQKQSKHLDKGGTHCTVLSLIMLHVAPLWMVLIQQPSSDSEMEQKD